jgi:hypothetical protein
MKDAFRLTDAQAEAADVVRQQLQVKAEDLLVAKDGLAGDGALRQDLDPRIVAGLRELHGTIRPARRSEDARAAAKTFLNKPIANIETGIVATVSRTSLDKMLSKGSVDQSFSPQAHMLAVANLDTLFELATLRLQRPSRVPGDDIARLVHFDVPMPFDTDVVRVKMLAKEFTDEARGTRLYLVQAVEITPGSVEGDPGRVDQVDPGVSGQSRHAADRVSSSPPGVTPTFAQMAAIVKAAPRGRLYQRPATRRAPALDRRQPKSLLGRLTAQGEVETLPFYESEQDANWENHGARFSPGGARFRWSTRGAARSSGPDMPTPDGLFAVERCARARRADGQATRHDGR